MNPRVRSVLAAIAGLALAAGLFRAFNGLPDFGKYPGPYGNVLAVVGVHERAATDIVTSIMFDYRGLDSLGEEFILFAALTGLALILRNEKEDVVDDPLPLAPGRPRSARTDAVRLAALLGIGLVTLAGAYLGLHGHLTPGGGFQGGAVAGTGLFLAYLGLGYPAFTRMANQDAWDGLEALGAGAYVVIGLVTAIAGGAFLVNDLPLGGSGQFFSSGTIALINAFVFIEVTAGFVLLFLEFARETRRVKKTK